MKKWRFQVGFDTSYDGFGNGVGNAGASGTGWGHGRGNSSSGRGRGNGNGNTLGVGSDITPELLTPSAFAPPCLETP